MIDGHGQKVSALDRLDLLDKVPVLVVWGTHDRVIPAAHAELVREALEHAEVVLLDGIGHTPHLSSLRMSASGSRRGSAPARRSRYPIE